MQAMNRHAWMLGVALAAVSLGGCRGLEKELEDLRAGQETLSAELSGLKVSDTPFSLSVVIPPADTLTKDQSFDIVFRVNPSGVPFTPDMIQLDCCSSASYFLQESGTKSSYVKASEYFSIVSFAPDKDDAGAEMEGQYVLTLKPASQDVVWNDSRLALVGAYRDKEGKVQYVSTGSCPVVMMPRSDEGLLSWYYPNASYYVQDKLGAVYMALDGCDFLSKDEGSMRHYSAAFLKDAVFTPDEGYPPLQAELDRVHHNVCFTPDTTENETWRAFKKVAGIHHQDVKGTLTLLDRWGGRSAFPVSMGWYNTTEFKHEVPVKMSEIDPETEEIHSDMTELFRSLGFDYALLTGRIRGVPSDTYHIDLDGDFSFETQFEDKSRILNMPLYGEPQVGASKTQKLAFALLVNPDDSDRFYTKQQISLTYDVTVLVVPE